MKIIILIPIYNDWQSATKLLDNINNEVSGIDHTFSIILVNDASTDQITENLSNFSNLNSVQIAEKIELLFKFFKSDSPIKKVLIEVFFDKSKSSSFVLIPLSEINGPG